MTMIRYTTHEKGVHNLNEISNYLRSCRVIRPVQLEWQCNVTTLYDTALTCTMIDELSSMSLCITILSSCTSYEQSYKKYKWRGFRAHSKSCFNLHLTFQGSVRYATSNELKKYCDFKFFVRLSLLCMKVYYKTLLHLLDV